jgi:hypothetical protein
MAPIGFMDQTGLVHHRATEPVGQRAPPQNLVTCYENMW